MVIAEKTIGQWLKEMATSNTSTEHDDKLMQNLTRRCGFPKSIVTCGIVYLEGYGDPMAIHTLANEILKRQPKQLILANWVKARLQ